MAIPLLSIVRNRKKWKAENGKWKIKVEKK